MLQWVVTRMLYSTVFWMVAKVLLGDAAKFSVKDYGSNINPHHICKQIPLSPSQPVSHLTNKTSYFLKDTCCVYHWTSPSCSDLWLGQKRKARKDIALARDPPGTSAVFRVCVCRVHSASVPASFQSFTAVRMKRVPLWFPSLSHSSISSSLSPSSLHHTHVRHIL